MKFYNVIFFHVFKKYYKNGNYKNDIPWLTASCVIGLSTFFYVANIIFVLYYFISEIKPVPNKLLIVFAFAFVIINYLWFTNQKKYLKIYDALINSNLDNKPLEVLSWIYIIIGFASVPIGALVVNS